MNEKRFIELLNLYVDQQLSGPEAAELEAEILSSPARRRTYHQYCRMQKGCAQLFEHERSVAPASATLARALTDADRKIFAFPGTSSRPVWARGYAFAAIAAAACVAFVVVRQTGGPSSDGAPSYAATELKVENVDAATMVMVASRETQSSARPTSDLTPVVSAPQLRALSVTTTNGMFFSEGAAPGVSSLVWMQDVQLKPIRKVSSEEFLFRSASPDKADAAIMPVRGPDEAATEMNAFTFQR